MSFLNDQINKPAIVFLLIIITPVIALLLYLLSAVLFKIDSDRAMWASIILVIESLFIGLIFSILGYILLKIRKQTNLKELIGFIVLLSFLVSILLAVYIYNGNGVPYIITLEEWRNMEYELPIETHREALAYAKNVKKLSGACPLVDFLSCQYSAAEYNCRICDLEDARSKKRQKEKWVAWVKYDDGIWFIRMGKGEYTKCETDRVFIGFNEKGYAKLDIIPRISKYRYWWSYRISNEGEFDYHPSIERCELKF